MKLRCARSETVWRSANHTRLSVLETRSDFRHHHIPVGKVSEPLANLAPCLALERNRIAEFRGDQAHRRKSDFGFVIQFVARCRVTEFIETRPTPILWQTERRDFLFPIVFVKGFLSLLCQDHLRSIEELSRRIIVWILRHESPADRAIEDEIAKHKVAPADPARAKRFLAMKAGLGGN